MANKWQLNEAKQIAYFDSNGDRQFAKEVWYIGQYNKYKVWPGSIYLTDIMIVGPGSTDYKYSIDANGNPTYKGGNDNIAFNGISCNNNFYIKGTIKAYTEKMDSSGNITTNELLNSYNDCYPYYIGTGDSENTYGLAYLQNTVSSTKLNPITGEYDYYCMVKFNPNYLGNDEDDNNVWVTPRLLYLTKWPNENNGYFVVKTSEHTDFGIRLKRAKISRSLISNYSSNCILGSSDSASFQMYIQTKWGGMESGSVSDGTTMELVSNSHPDLLDITYNSSTKNLDISVLKSEPGQTDCEFTVKFTAYDWSTEFTGIVHVLGTNYQIYNGTKWIDPTTESINISKDLIVNIKKASSYENIQNGNFTELTNFSLVSNNTTIVGISNKTLKPYKSGTAIITVTDNETGDEFDFICNVEVNEDTYVEINVSTTSGSSTVLQRCLLNNNTRYATIPSDAMAVSILFYSGETGNLQKSVYYKADKTISGWNGMSTSWPYSPSSTISLGGRTVSAGTSTFTISSTNNDDGMIGKLQLTFNK